MYIDLYSTIHLFIQVKHEMNRGRLQEAEKYSKCSGWMCIMSTIIGIGIGTPLITTAILVLPIFLSSSDYEN